MSVETVDQEPTGLTALRRRRILEALPEAMKARDVDLHLVFTRENSRDPFAEEVGLGSVVARACGIFHLDPSGQFHRTAIAASYDTTPIEETGFYETVFPYKEQGIKPFLMKTIVGAGARRIAINASRDLTIADGLTSGMRDYLEAVLGPDISSRFVSSEGIVLAMLGRKFPEEVALIEQAAVATQEILSEVLSASTVCAGVTTEKDIGASLEKKTKERGMEVAFTTVVVGPCRGHCSPSDRVIQAGDLIRIDFGVVHKGYCSDIQRTAYVLRGGETDPPAEIRKMFDVTVAAHEAALAALKPGATGLAVDSAARRVIEAAGYKGYPHAAGHGLGRKVHDVGPLLGPDWPERYGSLVRTPIEPGQVFALEPMVYTTLESQGGEVQIGLEEDLVVEPEGARVFGKPQQELILIS